MIRIDLTGEEAQAALTLFDIATKAAGLQAAPAALHLHQKVTAAMSTAALAEAKGAQQAPDAPTAAAARPARRRKG